MTETSARRPVRLVLTPRPGGSSRGALLTHLHQRAEFRASVRDAGGGARGGRPGFSDAVIIAVVAQALLPGLFQLLQSWVDQRRTEVSVRLQVNDSEVEIQVNGRTNAADLLDQATRALHRTTAEPAAGITDGQARPEPTA